ncbi:MAG: hypothetical protein IPO38_00445 [Rhodocyclaceae bacterium]|nr:hypothetical protein [Rhodocyclaceae bacterium]MBP6108669.1 hypothetical protein [Rhodocyclaceae bacterium]
MTMADERYRSITQARALLTEITRYQITDLEELRRQAEFVLRHFPDDTALYLIAMDLNPVPPLTPAHGYMLWPPAEKPL